MSAKLFAIAASSSDPACSGTHDKNTPMSKAPKTSQLKDALIQLVMQYLPWQWHLVAFYRQKAK
jgi:hypothetical protein